MILKLVEMAKRTYKLNRLDQYLANNELVYSFLNWIAFIFRCSLESLLQSEVMSLLQWWSNNSPTRLSCLSFHHLFSFQNLQNVWFVPTSLIDRAIFIGI